MHMNSGLVRYVICWSSYILLNRLRAFVPRKEMRVEEDAGLLVPNLEGVFLIFSTLFLVIRCSCVRLDLVVIFGQRTITQSDPQGKQTLVSHHS